LCPAQLQQQLQLRKTTTIMQDAHRSALGGSRSRQSIASKSVTRKLATAAADQPVHREDYVPFEGSVSSNHSGYNDNLLYFQEYDNPRNISTVSPVDPFSTIMINTSLATAPKRYPMRDGIGGELGEIHVSLNACLKVERLERAAVLVRRLAKIYPAASTELLSVHNQYLRSLV